MAPAGCGGESTETKTYLSFFVEKKEQRLQHGSRRLWRREYRDEDLPLVRSGEKENKGDDMALADCGGENKESKTHLLYVVEKKITKTTTSMVM